MRLYAALCSILFSALPLVAGPNAGVEIGLDVLSPACGLQGGDRVEFLLSAGQMRQVRQIKVEFAWQPPGAVVGAAASPTGAAEQFIAPGQPFVEADWAEYGMATFGTGLEGEGLLARFSFELAPAIDPTTPVHIFVDRVSLGPSSSERDTLRPPRALALGNYCDGEGRPVERGPFVYPRQQRRAFSPAPNASLADGSPGEIELFAHWFEAGAFRPRAAIAWHISNPGPGLVYALLEGDAQRVSPGQELRLDALADGRGRARLLLDAAPGEELATEPVRVRACADIGAEPACAQALLLWDTPPTAVRESDHGPLPQEPDLGPNYPNPFNATTFIPLFAPAALPLRLDIFDALGQHLATLVDGPLPAGRHLLHWDGRAASGRTAASGLYFYRLRVAGRERVRPMLLLR